MRVPSSPHPCIADHKVTPLDTLQQRQAYTGRQAVLGLRCPSHLLITVAKFPHNHVVPAHTPHPATSALLRCFTRTSPPLAQTTAAQPTPATQQTLLLPCLLRRLLGHNWQEGCCCVPVLRLGQAGHKGCCRMPILLGLLLAKKMFPAAATEPAEQSLAHPLMSHSVARLLQRALQQGQVAGSPYRAQKHYLHPRPAAAIAGEPPPEACRRNAPALPSALTKTHIVMCLLPCTKVMSGPRWHALHHP